jgi:hypothetical protein
MEIGEKADDPMPKIALHISCDSPADILCCPSNERPGILSKLRR